MRRKHYHHKQQALLRMAKVYDSRAAEEAVDKLVHHSTIVTIDGPSYRLKEKLELMKSIG